jgi:hypothetical protein
LGLLAAGTLVVSALCAACASPLPPMPYQVLEQLRPGVTTMADVEAALGEPHDAVELPGGEREWTYHFAPDPVPVAPDLPPPADTHRRLEILLLLFRSNGVLVRHEASRSLLGVRDAAHPAEPDHAALRGIPLPGETADPASHMKAGDHHE